MSVKSIYLLMLACLVGSVASSLACPYQSNTHGQQQKRKTPTEQPPHHTLEDLGGWANYKQYSPSPLTSIFTKVVLQN